MLKFAKRYASRGGDLVAISVSWCARQILKVIDREKPMSIDTSVESITARAEARYPDRPFLVDLPVNWVDGMKAAGFEPEGHFVLLYPVGCRHPYVAPVTDEGVEMIAKFSMIKLF